MSKEKHTPLSVGVKYKDVVFDNNNDMIAECYTPEIAELIIKSVNNYDRLVEALEELINGTNILDARVKAKQLLTELKS